MEDLDESIAAYRKLKDVTGRPVIQLGIALTQKGNREGAIAEYREVLRDVPNSTTAMINLAFLLANRGDNLDEALSYARRASAIVPGNVGAADTLGWVYFKKGMLVDAEDALLDGLMLEGGNHPSLRSHLASVMDARGVWTEDRRELRKLLEGELSARQLARMKGLLWK
jgi:Flp pilus assembly protein TadD